MHLGSIFQFSCSTLLCPVILRWGVRYSNKASFFFCRPTLSPLLFTNKSFCSALYCDKPNHFNSFQASLFFFLRALPMFGQLLTSIISPHTMVQLHSTAPPPPPPPPPLPTLTLFTKVHHIKYHFQNFNLLTCLLTCYTTWKCPWRPELIETINLYMCLTKTDKLKSTCNF